ncbi:hypothetical protein BDW69DRAFT_203167 [Aspergillus filifer]
MTLVENIYILSLAAAATSLILYRLFCAVCLWTTLPITRFGNRSIRHILLGYLVYPRVPVRILAIDTLSPLRIIFLTLFFAGTAVCNFIFVDGPSEASRRAAQISLALLIPLFLSGSREFPARLLGISLETYGLMHRVIGFVSVVEATAHVVIVSRNIKFDSSNPTHFNGLLGGCMLLSLLLLPMIKRRVYEVFLLQHLGCAITGFIATWKHTQPTSATARWCFISCTAAFLLTSVLQLMRIVYRNSVLGRKSVIMTVKPHAEDILHITLSLPRPWTVRAGERVNLIVPSLGLFYFFQTHPFTITWWEEDSDGSALSISLMFRARTGFTRKVYNCMANPDRDYWAWIDGPFGPSIVQEYGSLRDVGHYGHLLMVTSGIGIAAQLPYVKELIQRRHRAEVRTQSITLVWRLDRAGDWEGARNWLQQLVQQDNGYMLRVIVYDPLGGNSVGVGEHKLINFMGGEVDWDDVLLSEKTNQRGRLLVTVSAQRHIRRKMQKLVRENIQHNIELFELEFQPWREGRDWWSFLTP